MLDSLLLSRTQFGLNISFHILFPSITIALAWFLVYFKIRYSLSKDNVWTSIYQFWVKIFALSFALGIISGITMSFQFATHWPGFMEKVGKVAGPMFGGEIPIVFIMEVICLAGMLFGLKRLPNWLHTLSTTFVAIGALISAFWILALNSWMQTPQGFEIVNGIVEPTNWFEIIFNPSFPYRFAHTLVASGLTASFFIAGVSAYRLLNNDVKLAPKVALKSSIYSAAILIPLQIFIGDLHGLNTLEYQPQKIAAIEGHWETQKGVPFLLFAVPDETERTNHAEIAIPKLGSLILTHDIDGELKGLNEFIGEHPPVRPVFYGFRVMIGTGILMLLISWTAAWHLFRKKLVSQFMLKVLVFMTFSGWVATLAGWYVTEVGRQPYLVSGILTVADAAANIESSKILFSLMIYATVYLFLLIMYLRTVFNMAKKSAKTTEYETETSSISKKSNPIKEVKTGSPQTAR